MQARETPAGPSAGPSTGPPTKPAGAPPPDSPPDSPIERPDKSGGAEELSGSEELSGTEELGGGCENPPSDSENPMVENFMVCVKVEVDAKPLKLQGLVTNRTLGGSFVTGQIKTLFCQAITIS